MRRLVAAGLAIVAIVTAIVMATRARNWNDELAVAEPAIVVGGPVVADPHTPRLTDRVVMIVVDGLGAGEAHLPYLDELGARGVAAIAQVPYPTISRPNYVTLLSGVPPRDSGVRANRVRAPVLVDTIMDRVRAAGLHVATASDYGLMPSLFVRGANTLGDIAWVERGTHVTPPPGIEWPVDDARRVGSLAELGPTIAELAATDAAFVAVLVIDVDRAGHAYGVGGEYRAVAEGTDRMLRAAFANLDFAHSTVIITADHGHVAQGGHGGEEPEVATIPLVIAGAGIRVGASARDARSSDVAPTVAALLGVPAPGHAEGRALVELLALAPADAALREAADASRAATMLARAETGRAARARPDPLDLGAALAGLALAAALAFVLHRRGSVELSPRSAAGCVALVATLVATFVITRGHASPSYIPTLPRTTRDGAIGAITAIVVHVVVAWLLLRRARDRLAAANASALVGLATALVAVGLVRAWWGAPHLEVPPPLWMVGVPALELAAATLGVASAIVLVVAAVRDR